jgi:hypothetical protein
MWARRFVGLDVQAESGARCGIAGARKAAGGVTLFPVPGENAADRPPGSANGAASEGPGRLLTGRISKIVRLTLGFAG